MTQFDPFGSMVITHAFPSNACQVKETVIMEGIPQENHVVKCTIDIHVIGVSPHTPSTAGGDQGDNSGD